MAFVLIAVGLLLVISGARNTQGDLATLLYGDFSGPHSFLWWIASIGLIGGMGYIPTLRGISHAFLALIFIVFLVSNKGVFQNFTQAVSNVQAAPQNGTNNSSSTGLPQLPTPPNSGTPQ